MKQQYFSRPDMYFARTGDLKHWNVRTVIDGAPAFMKNVRALFISDLHVMPWTTDEQLKKLADSIRASEPDILLMGGDYAELRADALRFYDCIRKIDVPLGKYAVLGNNDPEDWPDYDQIRAAMKSCGIDLLVNECRSVSVAGGTVLVAGVDEHLEGAPDYEGLYPEIPEKDVYRILLSHYPCIPKVHPDLMLSGHTHGGQFNAFGITPFTIGFERIISGNPRSVAIEGLHDMDGTKLLVGKGIGSSRLHLRIGVRPEIYDLRFEC